MTLSMLEKDVHTIVNTDDDEAGRYAKSRILQRAGFRVLEAGTGAETLRLVREANPSLVLLDVHLPDMSGHEVCRVIRTDPARRATPVLQISASCTQLSDRVRGLDEGADAYLIEPVEADELVAMVRALLRLYQRENENRRLLAAMEEEIAERMRVEAALRESEARFRTMADTAPVLIWMADETRRCIWVNKPWLDFTGRAMEKELGQGWADCIHPEDLDPCLHLYSGSFESRRPFSVEYRLRRQDGQYRWFLDTGIPRWSASGEFLGYIGSCVDITEHRRQAAELRARGQQQHLLYELATAVNRAEALGELYTKAVSTIIKALNADRASVLIFDDDGHMRFKAWDGLSDSYRRAVERHSPWTRDTRDASPIIVPDVADSDMDPALQATIENEGIRALGFIPLMYAGNILGKFMVYFNRPYAMTAEEIGLAQAIAGTLALGIERKMAEQALLRLTEELESRVEERTRELVSSQERLRALASELSLAEQRERQRLATDLHDYLAQLLALSKIKLGQAKQQQAPPAVATLLTETQDVLDTALVYTRTLVAELSPPVLQQFGLPTALGWLSEQMKVRGLTVTVAMEPSLAPIPEDRARLLFQSVRELLINVAKHGRVDQATVRVRQMDGELTITVSDEGAGFDVSLVSDTVSAVSSKFGLFSIRERMFALGGRFEIVSTPGHGTRAMLMVPLLPQTLNSGLRASKENAEVLNHEVFRSETVSEADSVIGKPGTSLSLQNTKRIRVVLVDDHAMVRQGLRGLLEGYADIEVIGEAANGEAALRLTHAVRPDVVLMDVNMPTMDGVEATKRLKAVQPDLRIIGLSVDNNPHTERAMRHAGAAAFHTKEGAVEQLYRSIKDLLIDL
jgi:PAS domain S-box-containing protein